MCPNLQPSGFLQLIQRERPFHTIGVHEMEPFVTSARRNKYLLVAVCHLTKWIEARRITSADRRKRRTLPVRASHLQHGVPNTILTDRGTSLHQISNVTQIEALCNEAQRDYNFNPKADSFTERIYGVLAVAIFYYVNAHLKNWDGVVPPSRST